MRGRLFHKERPWLVFALIFALVLLRFCYYGFTYYPQLDDYIQLHNQSAYYSAKAVILDMGLLSSRPLASVMDYFFWSHFWPFLMAAVALLSAMYAASACLFRRVWGEYFGTGYVFLVIYALLPLGVEGTYWISASNRVVPSLFFVALAMYLFQKWCRTGRARWLSLYFIAQFISFCFYEQGLVLSVTGVLLVGIIEFFRGNHKKSLFALLTFVNAGIYFAFTGYFSTSTGQLGSRLKLTLPWQEGWDKVFLSAAGQTGESFLVGGYKTLFRGFRRGIQCILADFSPLWVVVLVVLCAALFLLARRFTAERPAGEAALPRPWALLVGFLMALAPVTLFFVLSSPSVALRNTVFSFCGMALFIDAVWSMLLTKCSARGIVTGAVCAVCAAVFSVAAVSEIHDYRATTLADQRVARAVTSAVVGDEDTIAVLNLEPNYLSEQNFLYHEHIHGATESTWALAGLLSWAADDPAFPAATPVPMGGHYAGSLTEFGALLWYDHKTGTVQSVMAVPAGEGVYEIHTAGGAVLAVAREENGTGSLTAAGD
ncbi:hypothetical protein WMO64_10435 [Pseudoflavonifractor sp. CLA-AP-H29]|uniref:Uncharacterized protein n=1 Tax=Pseudoflavonifractor intestinihominis TaxID=3133171 RepID=A0ABV1ECY8_9FIRM